MTIIGLFWLVSYASAVSLSAYSLKRSVPKLRVFRGAEDYAIFFVSMVGYATFCMLFMSLFFETSGFVTFVVTATVGVCCVAGFMTVIAVFPRYAAILKDEERLEEESRRHAIAAEKEKRERARRRAREEERLEKEFLKRQEAEIRRQRHLTAQEEAWQAKRKEELEQQRRREEEIARRKAALENEVRLANNFLKQIENEEHLLGSCNHPVELVEEELVRVRHLKRDVLAGISELHRRLTEVIS